jgi:hypothetical protein
VITLLALVVMVVICGLALGGRWRWSRHRDEKSIESHRSTLGVIEHVAGADESPPTPAERNAAHVRIVGDPSTPAPRRPDEAVLPTRPPQWHQARPSFPVAKDRALSPPEPPTAAGSAAVEAPPPPTRTPAGRRGGSSATTNPRRPRVLVGAAALILAAAAATGIALGTRSSPHSGKDAGLHPYRTGPAEGAGVRTPTPSTTTIAPPPTVVSTSSNSDYATYTANSARLTVQLAASSPCWIELRTASANGPVIYEGTLREGVTQSFPTTGSIWLRLGDPAGVRLTINGSPLVLPAAASPFDITVNTPA